MKRRWGGLFAAALLTMVGAMWMGQRRGTGLSVGTETIGMMIAAALAFVALRLNCVAMARGWAPIGARQ